MYDHKNSQFVPLNRRHFLKFSSGLISGLSGAPDVLAKNRENERSKKPNVLLVIADQYHGFKKRLLPNIYPTDFSWTKSRDHKIPKSHARSYLGIAVHVGRTGSNLEFDERAHKEALDYLAQKGTQKRQNSPYQPFFLCVSYNFPHEPFWPPKKYWDLYEDESIEIPELPQDFEKRVSAMDRWLNRHHGVDKVDLQKPSSLRKLWRAYYALITYIDDKVGELIDIAPTILDLVGVPTSERLDMDGESLIPLLKGMETSDRVVFSEMHSEGVFTRCFMIRKRKFKYIYIHEHDEQLFDLEKDPEEWNNLAQRSEYASIREELKKCILNQFDPDRIEKELRDSLRKRQFLMKAMRKTGWDWAYDPEKPL